MSDRSTPSNRWVGPGVLLVLVTAVVSGVSTFVNSYAVAGTNTDAFVTVRNLMVALALLPLAAVAGRTRLRAIDWGRLLVIGLIGGAVPFLLFFRGIELASASGAVTTASFLYRTLFLMAAVLGVVVLGERFSPRVALAAGLLLGGNVLLLSLTSPVLTDGSAYVLAATALWAAEYTISKRTLRDLPSPTVMLGRMGFGVLFLSGYLIATDQLGAAVGLTQGQWVWVGLSALLLTVFVASWYAGLKRVDLGVAASVLVLGYPVTWLLSVVVRGSAFTPTQGVGAAVVAGGVALALGWGALKAAARHVTRLVRPVPSADA